MTTTPETNFGGNPEDLAAFTDALGAVDAHNDEYSIGKVMARAITSEVKKAVDANELVEMGATEEDAEIAAGFAHTENMSQEREVARSILGMTNLVTLEQVGLGITPMRPDSFIIGNGEELEIGKVRASLVDGGKLTSFLDTIEPENLTEAATNSIKKVLNGLVLETREAVRGTSDDEGKSTLFETLAYAPGIVVGLERLGLGDTDETSRLKALAEHNQQGDLREYVIMGDMQLDREIDNQQFGPAQWYLDASPDFLRQEWGKVIDFIRSVQTNPQAKDTFRISLDNARKSLEASQADWAVRKTTEPYASSKYGKGFEDIFETIKLELDFLDPDANDNPS